MARNKSTLQEMVATVGEVMQTVGAEVGLIKDPKPKKTKSARRAAHKAIVQRVEQAEKLTKAARRAAHRRVVGLDPVENAASSTSPL
jgi:hypothetical protein